MEDVYSRRGAAPDKATTIRGNPGFREIAIEAQSGAEKLAAFLTSQGEMHSANRNIFCNGFIWQS